MYIGNRWVPPELANTLIVGAIVMALIIAGALLWFNRSGSTIDAVKRKHATRKKRAVRKKK